MMFWNKKKTQLELLIEKDGIDHAAGRLAEIINEKIGSHNVALQFVLEELDAGRQGNATAQRFVRESGFNEHEYAGALHNSFDEVDGENGPQQFLNMLLLSQLQHNMTSCCRASTAWSTGSRPTAACSPRPISP